MVKEVGGNDEEAEGDDDGIEEVVGVQNGILQRLTVFGFRGPVFPGACTAASHYSTGST
jgi:hypothetical protein